MPVSSNKTILHITPFFEPNIGGVETHLTDLTNGLDHLGFHNIILTYSPLTTNTTFQKYQKIGHRSFVVRFHWIGHNLFHRLEHYPLLNFIYLTPYLFIRSFFYLLIKHPKIDIIHSHGINGAFIGNILKYIFKIPRHITSIYSSYDQVPINKLMIMTLNSTDKILAQSKQSKKQLINLGIKPQKIDLYRHWIDLKVFKPTPKKTNNIFTVLFIGRMNPEKGVLLLAKIAKSLPDIKFLFVGDGPDFQQLKTIATKTPNITLFGNVPYGLLYRYYQQADIFCIPSLYNEGWGRVIMEALACGLPVVASNRGAIPEVIDNSVALIISPTFQNLKNSILLLSKNKTIFQKLKNNSVSYARQHFSAKNIQLITRYY